MDPFAELGRSGVKRSFLRQLLQVCGLIALGVAGGLFVANRESRLNSLEAQEPVQDSMIARNWHHVDSLAVTLHLVNRRLCNIERAVHAEIDETCPPRIR